MTALIGNKVPQKELRLVEDIYKFGDNDATTAKLGTKALYWVRREMYLDNYLYPSPPL